MDTERITSIKLKASTRDALLALKGDGSYDGLLERLMALVPAGDEEGAFTPQFRRSLLDGLLYEGPRLTLDGLKHEFDA